MFHKIYVDFNSRTGPHGIIIHPSVISAGTTIYHAGDLVTLYDEELEVDARLEYHAEEQWWVGIPDWSTKRNIPN